MQMTAHFVSAGHECAPLLPDWDHGILLVASGQKELEVGDKGNINKYLDEILRDIFLK